jgi:hypothetical protein
MLEPEPLPEVEPLPELTDVELGLEQAPNAATQPSATRQAMVDVRRIKEPSVGPAGRPLKHTLEGAIAPLGLPRI